MNSITSMAAQAYARNRNLAEAAPGKDAGFSFTAAADSFTQTLLQHEAAARAAMTGKADPHALVEALAASQLAVETVVAIRNRVVEAYQEILRMPI